MMYWDSWSIGIDYEYENLITVAVHHGGVSDCGPPPGNLLVPDPQHVCLYDLQLLDYEQFSLNRSSSII